MHPNIVNVYDVGEENGIYYIVMELVEGITLKKFIEKKGRLEIREAVGIAIQNFPEGAIISMPLKSEGVSKPKSFLLGVMSGVVEPIAAIITILLIKYINPILPYLLSFAAWAMIYVVVEELIPESQSKNHSNFAKISLAIGFTLMMILDIALG